MAPRSPQSDLGERIAALAASFESFEKYEHDRWHKLANDLQPLINLPTQLARDMATVEARLEAKLGAFNATTDARLHALEYSGGELSGAKKIAVWIVQTVISALAALTAIFTFGGHR